MHTITGAVVRGAGRGAQLGFPTLNIQLEHILQLPFGVYAGRVEVHGVWYSAAISWGIAAMFHEAHTSLEAHLIGFSKIIPAGEQVRMEVHEKIREFIAFESVDTLVQAIHSDIARVVELMN